MPRVIAAFDFDKTLSSRDNVLPFLRRVAGDTAVARSLLAAAPRFVARRRDDAKARVLRRLVAGRPADDIRTLGDEFARDVVARHLRDDVVARAAWHRGQGHEVVLVSASLDVYLERVGELLGFDAVLCTSLEVGADGRLTGRIAGANVRGPEKARRLDAWLADDAAVVYAYGDSAGDRELLARADHPVRIGRIGDRLATPGE